MPVQNPLPKLSGELAVSKGDTILWQTSPDI